jgi:uncharacterized protein YidB (DUF937 family)
MNGNPLIGQLLGGVFGHAMQRRGMPAPARRGVGGVGGVAVAAILARMMGRTRGNLLLLLLPLALRWVERNGGVAALLKRIQNQGYGAQANSWVATGANRDLDEHAIHELVGQQELEQLSQQTGVPQHELAHGFAEILPEVVDQLTPAGTLTPEADALLEDGRTELEEEIVQATRKQAGATG